MKATIFSVIVLVVLLSLVVTTVAMAAPLLPEGGSILPYAYPGEGYAGRVYITPLPVHHHYTAYTPNWNRPPGLCEFVMCRIR